MTGPLPAARRRLDRLATAAADPARRLFDRLATAAADPVRLAVLATVVLFLALPQVYLLPRGSVDIALGTVVALLLAPVILFAARGESVRRLLRLALVRILLLLLALRLLTLAWSPEPRAGLQSITLLGQFVVTLVLMSAVAGYGTAPLRGLQLWYWPWVLFEAGLVVVFRVLPGLEDAFLHSIAGYFAGQNAVAALFGDNPNNVLDPAKAGGVFINANVAAMFLGINGLAAFALAALTGARWVRVVGVVALLAVPFTGSKSATVLVVALPAAAYGLHRLRRYPTGVLRRYLLIATVPLGAALALLFTLNRGFLDALLEAFAGRSVIWRFGAEAFRDSPLLGLGYGGWNLGFAAYADQHDIWRVFPPHNILLGAWAVTGIAGLALTVGFFVVAFRLVARRMSTHGQVPRVYLVCVGTALAWILVQGLGENTDIFGDIHLIPIVAVLVAYLIRPVIEESGNEESEDNVSHPDGGRRTTSAVPAVGDVHHEPGPGDAELPAVVRGEGPGPEPAADRRG